MKRLTVLLLLISNVIFAQKSVLTLDSCIRLAKANYPLIKQNNLLNQIEVNNIKEDNKNWLPHLNFLSQAVYQSEETSFPGFNLVIPKDQYTNALTAEQVLFDAGQTKQQKRLELLNETNEIQKNEVELYKLIDRINQLYSSILLSRENIKTLDLYTDDIKNRKVIISSSVKNGLVLQSNLDELEAEELKTEQATIEAKDNLNALYESLSLFTKKSIDDNIELAIDPIVSKAQSNDITRPEIKMFSTQKDLLDARYKLTNKAAFPKLTIFGQGIYGRPGYNFLDQSFRFYGEVGASLKWNIGNLYNLGKEKQNLNITKQMVDVQKEVFEFNLQTNLMTQSAQIKSLKDIIEKDKRIIEKRQSIKETSATQLANGIITSTEYLTQLNAEMQARLGQKMHEIKLMNAISNYTTTKGITNF